MAGRRPFFSGLYEAAARRLIPRFENIDEPGTRLRYGIVAGWVSILVALVLFVLKVVLASLADSVSILADAFHLLSHLANSAVLVLSFRMASRPATAETPFGHGRMEHVAPLVMSIFLFVSGIQIAERAVHQALHPAPVHYWTLLPWILLLTILVKQWLAGFIRYLGERVRSHAILVNAFHHRIEAAVTLAVIAGLVAGHHFERPEFDGYIGIAAALWILYLGFQHGREAVLPLLGRAPGRELIESIRMTARSVEGIEDVHEIIVHDYGNMYILTLHAEIPEHLGPDRMHAVSEHCEARLRKQFRGEVVCHTDPLLELTPELKAVEHRFRQVVDEMDEIVSYHDFRLVAFSPGKLILVADIDAAEEIPEKDFPSVAKKLERRVLEVLPEVEYCTFYVTPKFAYS
jgi:cation diffusion facilitator family transporter